MYRTLLPEIKAMLSEGRSQREIADPVDIVAEQAYEIKRLKMENELLRDFLRFTERK